MICPKCNYQRKPDDDTPDWQCPACGIAYAKFQNNSESAPASPPEQSQKQKMDFNSVLGISAGVCVVLLASKGLFAGGVGMFNGLLLVPFFFCIVTVLSTLLCDDIYLWNKWEMQFVPYDKEHHPVMYRFMFVFSAIASVVFVIFFFMLR